MKGFSCPPLWLSDQVFITHPCTHTLSGRVSEAATGLLCPHLWGSPGPQSHKNKPLDWLCPREAGGKAGRGDREQSSLIWRQVLNVLEFEKGKH